MKDKKDVIFSELTREKPDKDRVLGAALAEMKKKPNKNKKILSLTLSACSTLAVVLLLVFLLPKFLASGGIGGGEEVFESSQKNAVSSPSSFEGQDSASLEGLPFYIEITDNTTDERISESKGDVLLTPSTADLTYQYKGSVIRVYEGYSTAFEGRLANSTEDFYIEALSVTAKYRKDGNEYIVGFDYLKQAYYITVEGAKEDVFREILGKITKK